MSLCIVSLFLVLLQPLLTDAPAQTGGGGVIPLELEAHQVPPTLVVEMGMLLLLSRGRLRAAAAAAVGGRRRVLLQHGDHIVVCLLILNKLRQ